MSKQITLRTAVTNDFEKDIILVIEPWTDEITLAPEETVYVEATGPEEGSGFSWYFGKRGKKEEIYVAISSWGNTTAKVFNEEGEVILNLDLETPDFRM